MEEWERWKRGAAKEDRDKETRWKEEVETSRWRGGGGEDGGDGARWKEDGGVVRRGQVVAAGARAKGDASRRSGVSPVSSSPNVINCSVYSQLLWGLCLVSLVLRDGAVQRRCVTQILEGFPFCWWFYFKTWFGCL